VTGAVVTTPPYDLWAQAITNAALRGDQEDADGDGYANLWEYSQGTDATNGADGLKVLLVRRARNPRSAPGRGIPARVRHARTRSVPCREPTRMARPGWMRTARRGELRSYCYCCPQGIGAVPPREISFFRL